MATKIIYEIPISPRVKDFLAFERTCQRVMALRDQAPPWGLHSAILALLDLEKIAAKGSLRRELVKELKRQIGAMEKLSLAPSVDHELLDNIVIQQRRLIESLEASSKNNDQIFRDNELLNSQRKRIGLHYNNNQEMDNAAYQHLMGRPMEEQSAVLNKWMQPFHSMQQATDVVLGLIRSSAAAADELAYQGFFQGTWGRDKKCQLLRISLSEDYPYYPEISLGRSKFSLRFLEPTDQYEHAMQIEEDVAFKLTRCAL